MGIWNWVTVLHYFPVVCLIYSCVLQPNLFLDCLINPIYYVMLCNSICETRLQSLISFRSSTKFFHHSHIPAHVLTSLCTRVCTRMHTRKHAHHRLVGLEGVVPTVENSLVPWSLPEISAVTLKCVMKGSLGKCSTTVLNLQPHQAAFSSSLKWHESRPPLWVSRYVFGIGTHKMG